MHTLTQVIAAIGVYVIFRYMKIPLGIIALILFLLFFLPR